MRVVETKQARPEARIVAVVINRHTVKVDEEVWEKVKDWTWHVIPQSRHCRKFRVRGYPKGGGSKRQYLHRIVLDVEDPKVEIDHINGDTLDNRRENLRVVVRTHNQRNRGKNANNTSGYKGVGFDKRRNTWHARVQVLWQSRSANGFDSAEEAAAAYDTLSLAFFGEEGVLNFPREDYE